MHARRICDAGLVVFLSLAIFHSQYNQACIELLYKRNNQHFIVPGIVNSF